MLSFWVRWVLQSRQYEGETSATVPNHDQLSMQRSSDASRQRWFRSTLPRPPISPTLWTLYRTRLMARAATQHWPMAFQASCRSAEEMPQS
jgi:hypothetical protein